MKFACLMGPTYGWTILFLEIIGLIEPPIWRKMGPQNQFFGFHSAGMEFFMEKTSEKFISFLSSDAYFASKMVTSHNIIFRSYVGKYLVFFLIVRWKIFINSFPIDFCHYTPPSPKNSHVFPQMVFHNFFKKCCIFKTATRHLLSLRLVIPHLVSHLMSPPQAASQHSLGLTGTSRMSHRMDHIWVMEYVTDG